MTASVDTFPRQLQKGRRRELLILAIAVVCYLMGLFLVTEVSRGLRPAGPSQSHTTPSADWGCGPRPLPHRETAGRRTGMPVLISSPLAPGDQAGWLKQKGEVLVSGD